MNILLIFSLAFSLFAAPFAEASQTDNKPEQTEFQDVIEIFNPETEKTSAEMQKIFREFEGVILNLGNESGKYEHTVRLERQPA